jgi:hypothetical protein
LDTCFAFSEWNTDCSKDKRSLKGGKRPSTWNQENFFFASKVETAIQVGNWNRISVLKQHRANLIMLLTRDFSCQFLTIQFKSNSLNGWESLLNIWKGGFFLEKIFLFNSIFLSKQIKTTYLFITTLLRSWIWYLFKINVKGTHEGIWNFFFFKKVSGRIIIIVCHLIVDYF